MAAIALLCLLGGGGLNPQAQPADGVDAFVDRLRHSLDTADETAFRALFETTLPSDQISQYRDDLMPPGIVRRVLRERERSPLLGVSEAAGRRVVVEIFEEAAGRARMLTTGLTIRRPNDSGADAWRIVAVDTLGAVQGLYRLRLDTARQYAARNLVVTAPDLRLTLEAGAVFLIDSDEGITGAVLLGRGEVHFSPAPEPERGQLRLFGGSETLVTPFESVLLRMNPADYPTRIAASSLSEVPVDRDMARRAAEVADRELPKSFNVDLRDVSTGLWHLLPGEGDVLAEIRTRRFGTLTFSRSGSQAEDISLFNRERKLTISLYTSAGKLLTQGRFYSDESQREIDVRDYSIETSISPADRFVRGRARLALRTAMPLSTFTLRLADSLAVTSVTSEQQGPLTYLRLRNQNAVIVRLPQMLAEGAELTVIVAYAGSVVSQTLEETVQVGQDPGAFGDLEPHLLLSSATYWYPQNPFTDYATATLRFILPDEYSCVGSGELTEAVTDALRSLAVPRDGHEYVFRAQQPLRYLAAVISRFTRVSQQTVALAAAPDLPGEPVLLNVETQPLQKARGRELMAPLADVLRFYSGLLGDAPFSSATLAIVESDLPGGHSPGYFAMLNSPVFVSAVTWQNDPAAFQGFPEFFLAHELAHQWWGQAVAGKNYHEAWLSEGFAQYFSALYAQQRRGDRVFTDMLRQFRKWSLSDSDEGPIYLGRRLGQIKGGRRVFRALVYNKGAAVLHMLRRMVGDEPFFRALRRFYQAHRFQTAGTDDLQRAFEAETGRPLDRFFERWIYGSELPRVVNRSSVVDGRAVVRLEQLNERVFDLPVTITLTLDDGTANDVVVVMTEKRLEQPLATERRVRQVQINRDSGALAEFENGR